MGAARPKRSALRPESEHWALPVQQERSLATRERIVAAAEKAFAEKGYEGARISDIAKRAGCSVGAVYFRFADKDALFFAIVESFRAGTRERLPVLAASPFANPEEVIAAFVSATAIQAREHRGMFRAIVERGFDHSLAMDIMFSIRDELQSFLETALGRFGRKYSDLSFTVRMMSQMVYGFLLAGVLNDRAPTRLDETRTVRELTAALNAYLKSAERER
ncbi:MAG TPA: TetR/AcrR family transcriptional regulator [Rhizomicrobium sp.]|jgi:AcrR family transcriptional regulator|nr:TetR/AcrR family transcriptional regulator [Rhizomicrobium sp.]